MRKRYLGIVILLLLLATASAGATSLAPTSEEELTAKAAVIVLGHCTAVETRWQGRTLYTLATVAVEEAWKGDPGTSLTLALPGGIDVNRPVPIDVHYPGAPRLAPGEAAVLFLMEDPAVAGAYTVVGFNAGAVPVIAAPEGDAVLVQRSVGRERASLEAMAERIRRRVAEEGGAQ